MRESTADVRWANDRAIRISFGESASPEAHARVRAFVLAIAREPFPGLVDLHPAYDTVLVVVDPRTVSAAEVEGRVRRAAEGGSVAELPPARRVEIPVVYGGAFGPDLEEVARQLGLDEAEIVRRHASASYTVAFLGFVPGFAYLSGLPEELRVPRLPVPRSRVPAGSLGITGSQTAVYPLATPGGWRLIGRTPLALFRADREPPALLAVGDSVAFVPIGAEEFERRAGEPRR